MRFVGILLLMSALMCSVLTSPLVAQDDLALKQAQAAFEDMNRWLGAGDNGQGWQKYLANDQLQKQFDLGRKANHDKIQEVLEIYQKDVPGLNRSQFVKVREGVEQWLAALKSPALKDLPELAETAAADAEAVDEARLTQAKQQAQRAIQGFEFFLRTGGTARSEGWKKFLRIEDLKTQLEAEEPNLDTMTQVWALFAGDTPGLDHPRFATTREALRQYLEVAAYFENEQSDFARLPEALKNHQRKPSRETASDLANLLGWLARTDQAAELRQAIDFHYTRPNLLVQASEELVVAGFADTIDREKPINTYDNGSVRGTEKTQAEVEGQLVRNLRQGEVRVSMIGDAQSELRRQTSGVTIDSSSETTIDAYKPIYFTPEGIKPGASRAACETKITIKNISAQSAQVQQIAEQRVRDNKANDERQAARQAEAQTRAELNSDTAKRLADANGRMESELLMPLIRHGAQPRRLDYYSTEDYLFATVVQATQDELAADSAPPNAGKEGDLIARMHQSWLNNAGAARFRGVLLTDERLAKWLEEERGEVPEDLQVGPDTDPWDITFHSRTPLDFQVSKDRLFVTLRGIAFTARDRKMEEPMHVKAAYKVVRSGGQVKMVRDGDLEVSFPEQAGKRLGVRHIAMKRFWGTKFKALFEEEVTELPIELEGDWAKAGELQWSDVQLHDQWATITWKLVPVEETTDEDAAQ